MFLLVKFCVMVLLERLKFKNVLVLWILFFCVFVRKVFLWWVCVRFFGWILNLMCLVNVWVWKWVNLLNKLVMFVLYILMMGFIYVFILWCDILCSFLWVCVLCVLGELGMWVSDMVSVLIFSLMWKKLLGIKFVWSNGLFLS